MGVRFPPPGVAARPLGTLLYIRPERTPGSRVMYLGVGHSNREGNMDGLYLGIAIAGVNALVAMGLVIAFM